MQKVPFSDEEYLYQAPELYSILSINKEVYVENTFCTRIMCAKCQTTSYVCNRFKMNIFFKFINY